MFFSVWKFVYAVFDDPIAGLKKSIQIFDTYGNAIVKIYPQSETHLAVFDQIVRDFQTSTFEPSIEIVTKPASNHANPEEVDISSFQKEWSALKDTHDFFPLMLKYNLSRIDAIRNGGEFCKRVSNQTATDLLYFASKNQLEIMVFVGNDGMIQIHTGKVENILAIPDWINVMDLDFNLHLKTSLIHETYLVKKPTVDGVVHSVECFDTEGNLIVQFFGKRKPGVPELEEWRECVRIIVS